MDYREVYLTIDDGPSSNFRKKIDFLYSQNIPAIFFCIGHKIKKDPEAIVYAAKKGFLIGNHSYTHLRFSNISINKAMQEIDKTDQLIKSIFQDYGIKQEKKFFRFPFGDKGDLKYGFLFKDFNEAFLLGKGIPQWAHKKLSYLLKPVMVKKQMEGLKRKMAIQDFLRQSGYTNFPFYIHYQYNTDLLNDYDWSWTYDTMDWSVNKKRPYDQEIHRLYERLSQKNPVDFRGCPEECYSFVGMQSKQIILMHDYDTNFEVFKDLVIRLKCFHSVFIDLQ